MSPGFRAFTLDVSEAAGVGHLLRPGDRVDLLVKLSPNANQQATAFLLQNIQVLPVGQKLNGTKSPRKNGEGEERELFRQTEEAASAYNHVTLALTPAEAETLFALEGSNLVKLVLRAPGDDEIVSIPKKSEAEVFSKLGVPYSPGPGKTKLKHGLAGSPPEEAP